MSDATSTSIGGRLTLPAFIQWAVALFKSPREFFRGMERTGGYLTPILYLAGWSFLSAVISFLVGLLRPAPALGGRAAQVAGLVAGPLGALAIAFGVVVVYLFVIWHWMGSKENFQTAFRVWAFMGPVSAVIALLGLLPVLQVLGLAYALYLIVIASQEVHGIDARRSWIVWGVLGGFMLLFTAATVVASKLARAGRGGAAFSALQ